MSTCLALILVLGAGNIAMRKQTWPLAFEKLRVDLGERQIISNLINKIIATDCEKYIKGLEIIWWRSER